jgi:hypothetical protein
MPTAVFGHGHVAIGYRHAHEDVGMAPGFGESRSLKFYIIFTEHKRVADNLMGCMNVKNYSEDIETKIAT